MTTSCTYYLAYCPIIMLASAYKKIHRSFSSSDDEGASTKRMVSCSDEKPRKMKLRAVTDWEC